MSSNMQTTKVCEGCNEDLPLTEYRTHTTKTHTYVRNKCKSCRNHYVKRPTKLNSITDDQKAEVRLMLARGSLKRDIYRYLGLSAPTGKKALAAILAESVVTAI